jgi:tetratricopeptide (TPR) repeat protein
MTATTQPLSSASLPSSQAGARPGALWIWGPWPDLLIGCGGWSAPLLVVAYVATKSHTLQWSFAFYFLALIFNYPHFMATVYRAYHTREQFEKYRIFTLHIAVLLALTGAFTVAWPVLLPWVFTLYICWSPWHYSGQNFGLLMMFARRNGLSPEKRERQALYAAFIASYVLLMLNFHTGVSTDDMILSLGLPARWVLWPKIALALFFVFAGGWALTRFARRAPSWREMAGPTILFLSQFMWFVVFVGLELSSRLEAQQTRYSTGMLAVLHSTQYLWITSYYQRRESRAAGQLDWRFTSYFATLIAGGIALFVPVPWIVSRVLHKDFVTSFLTFTALVNIHHFILDGAIWKLRDSRIAALLIGSGDKAAAAAPAAPAARRSVLEGLRWLAGSTRGAHWARVGVALLLLGWGLMDQARYYWASVEGGPVALNRAAKLNPYDSNLLGRIARLNQKAGDPSDAVVALVKAVQLNPQSRPLRHSLARALATAGRYQDAERVYRDLLSGYPKDVEALINSGLLAQKLGRPDEAMDDWRRAIAADPWQGNAELYLADALTQRGEAEAAARHYRAYLRVVAARPAEHAGDVKHQLAAQIKVADADARAGRVSEAALGYDVAIHLAEKEKDPALESQALVHRAELEADQNRPQRAAAFFQQALALDASVTDRAAVADDWAEYGQLLSAGGLPERLAYACFLHAEELLSAAKVQGPQQVSITGMRAASEVRLGSQAAGVKRQLDAVLKEALAVPPAQFARK